MTSTQIYSATYSGVPVYEFLTKEGPVMRRKVDGWVNATHILKVANFPKAKRTRILERDVQTGDHEKVQGGYGKYQGTWVPLEAAKAIAKQFDVSEVLAPIFDYVAEEGVASPPQAPKHHHASTLAKASLSASFANSKDPSATAARKLASMPLTKPRKRGRPRRVPLEDPPLIQQQNGPNFGVFAGKQSVISNQEKNGTQRNLNITTNQTTQNKISNITPTQQQYKLEDLEMSSPVSDIGDVQIHVDPSSSPSDFMSDSDLAHALRSPQKQSQSARDTLERALVNNFNHQSHRNPSQICTNIDAHIPESRQSENYKNDGDYTNKLLEYFMVPDEDNGSNDVPEFLTSIPSDFNVDQVIDNEGHTALHWACAMGSLKVIELLINAGANISCLNSENETPLMRAVAFTNCYSKKVFPRICELLKDTLMDTDSNGRTALHHIAVGTDSKARSQAAKYYIEILLAKISEIGTPEKMSAFINQEDRDGNSALHILAHKNAKKCIKIMLGYGASADIPNSLGHTVEDYLLQHNFYLLNSTPRFNSHVEELVDDSYYNGFIGQYAKPSDLINGMRGGSSSSHPLSLPHHSETAIHATQKVASALVDSLGELSNAFDQELQAKDADAREVQKLLSDLNKKIEATKDEILKQSDSENQFEKSLSIEVLQDQSNNKVEEMQAEYLAGEEIYAEKTATLKKLLERSQAKDLAQTIEVEENKITGDAELEEDYSESEHLKDLIELTRLQVNRKKIVDDIVDLHSQSSGSEAKMQNYRRLIALCCDIQVMEVDNLLDGIEEVLKS